MSATTERLLEGFSDEEIANILENLDELPEHELQSLSETLAELENRDRVASARDDLIAFCQFMDPNYIVGRHHRILAELLMACERGDKDRIAVNIAPRHGKQIADSTPVLTTTGWKTHGELCVGDFVFSPSGVPVQVLAVSEKTPSDYVVTTSAGEEIRCHAAHEWTVYSYSDKAWRTVETTWFTEPSKAGPTIGQPRKLTHGTVGARGGRYRYSLPEISPLEYTPSTLPVDPYFLGVWLGDGTAGKVCFCCDPKDQEPRAELSRRGFEESAVWQHSDTGVLTISYGGQDIASKLRGLGCFSKKTIPTLYLQASVDQRLDLLAGLIDTDGHVERSTGRVRVATCSELLKDTLVELLRGLGQHPYVYEQAPTTSSSGIVGRSVVYYVGFQPSIDIPTTIPRKRISRLAKRRKVSITSVRYEPNGEQGHCVQVDSEDGLYLVGKYLTPTHNSHLVSTMFPAWYLGRNPKKQLIMASHTADLAVDFGRKVRNIIKSEEYAKIFPEVTLAQDSKSAGRWNTNHGGMYYAGGVGGALAGRGADLLLIDDPHSEQDVLNGNYEVFDKAYDWYTYGARTRLMPGGAVALVQTRWHTADLTGRLIDDMQKNELADKFEVVEFPAIMEVERAGKTVEKPLWPEFFDLDSLLRTKASMPAFQWNAQYQQNPTAEEAAIVKREWWKTWVKDDPPRCEYIIMSLDTASETKTRSDFTAITTWGVFHNEAAGHAEIILLNSIKERYEFPELKAKARQEYDIWEPDAFIVEKKSSGVALYQELRRSGLIVSEYTPHRGTGDKVARLNSVADIVKSGYCWVPQTRWAEELVDEIAGFPFMQHDDLVDSTVMALMRFRQGGFVTLHTDEQEEPTLFRRRRAYY